MKVAYLLGALNRGGAETLVLDVFRNTKAHNLDLICIYRKEGSLLKEFLQTTVKCLKLNPKKSKFLPGYLVKLRKLIIAENVQIIHAHQPIDAFYAYWALINTKIKIILTLHGHHFEYNQLLLKFILKKTSANFFVSNDLKNSFIRHFSLPEAKCFVLYNGIDQNKLSGKKTSLREGLHIGDHVMLLGMVGNFYCNGRDQLTVCKAFKQLHDINPNVSLLFVGGKSEQQPHYFDNCVSYCKNNNLEHRVHFLGQRPDIPDILYSLDIFVYASNNDTFGIAVVEAMMAGVPTVINDIPAFKEISDNGNYASLYESKNTDQLTKLINDLIQDDVKRKNLSQRSSTWALSVFSINAHVQRLKNLYQKV